MRTVTFGKPGSQERQTFKSANLQLSNYASLYNKRKFPLLITILLSLSVLTKILLNKSSNNFSLPRASHRSVRVWNNTD